MSKQELEWLIGNGVGKCVAIELETLGVIRKVLPQIFWYAEGDWLCDFSNGILYARFRVFLFYWWTLASWYGYLFESVFIHLFQPIWPIMVTKFVRYELVDIVSYLCVPASSL